MALLLEAPRGNTESAIADVTTVAVKVECVLKVPFVARLRRALPIGFWRWLSRLQVVMWWNRWWGIQPAGLSARFNQWLD